MQVSKKKLKKNVQLEEKKNTRKFNAEAMVSAEIDREMEEREWSSQGETPPS